MQSMTHRFIGLLETIVAYRFRFMSCICFGIYLNILFERIYLIFEI